MLKFNANEIKELFENVDDTRSIFADKFQPNNVYSEEFVKEYSEEKIYVENDFIYETNIIINDHIMMECDDYNSIINYEVSKLFSEYSKDYRNSPLYKSLVRFSDYFDTRIHYKGITLFLDQGNAPNIYDKLESLKKIIQMHTFSLPILKDITINVDNYGVYVPIFNNAHNFYFSSFNYNNWDNMKIKVYIFDPFRNKKIYLHSEFDRDPHIFNNKIKEISINFANQIIYCYSFCWHIKKLILISLSSDKKNSLSRMSRNRIFEPKLWNIIFSFIDIYTIKSMEHYFEFD